MADQSTNAPASPAQAPVAPVADVDNPFLKGYVAPVPDSENPFIQGPQSTMSDVGRAIKHAPIGIERQVGESAQFAGHLADQAGFTSLGAWLAQSGAGLNADAASRENYGNMPSYQQETGGLIHRNMPAAAEGLAQTGLTVGAGAAIGAGIGSVVPLVGTLAGAGVGATLGMLAQLPLFAGSAGENTFEGVKAAQLKGGAGEDQANATATEAGLGSAAVMGGLQYALQKVGVGKILAPALDRAAGAKTGEVVMSVLDDGLKKAAVGTATTAGEMAGLTGAQYAATQGINEAGGYGDGPTLAGTADAALQGGAMGLVLGAGGAGRQSVKTAGVKGLLADPTASPEDRANAALGVAAVLQAKSKPLAQDFGTYASSQIVKGLPVEVQPDAFYATEAREIRNPTRFLLPAPAQSQAPNVTDTTADIFAQSDADHAIAAFEESVNKGIDSTEQSVADISKAQDFYAQQAAQAQEAMRQEALAAAQQQQAQGAPAVPSPADVFAQNEAQQEAQKAQDFDAAQMQAGDQNQAVADAQQAAVDKANGGTPQEPGITPQGATPHPVAPTPPTTAVGGPLHGELNRVASIMANNPRNVTSTQLAALASLHPDDAVKQQATQILQTRRNRDAVQAQPDVGGAGPQPTTLDAHGNMAQGEATPEFSAPRAPAEGTPAAEAPAAAAQPARALEQTAPELQPLKAALDREAQANGQAAGPSIVPVDATTLPDKPTAANNGVAGATTLSKPEHTEIQKFLQLFGQRLVVYRGEGADAAGLHEGVTLSNDGKTVYLNADAASASHLAIVGHELAHQMEKNAPDLYEGLSRALAQHFTGDTPRDFYRYYNNVPEGPGDHFTLKDGEVKGEGRSNGSIDRAMADPATHRQMMGEFIADLVGNRAGESRTWTKMFSELGGNDNANKGLIYRIADFITSYIDRLMQHVPFRKFATDSMVKDLGSVRDNVRQALKEYAQRSNAKPMQHEADQMRARQENKRAGAEAKLATPVKNDRADVGREPSKAAPAPVAERAAPAVQGSRDIEPIKPPEDRSKPTPIRPRDDGAAPESSQDSGKPDEGPKPDTPQPPAAGETGETGPKAEAPQDEPQNETKAQFKARVKAEIKAELAAEREAKEKAAAADAEAKAQAKANADADARANRSAAAKKREALDTSRDSLWTALSKMGGLNPDAAKRIGYQGKLNSRGERNLPELFDGRRRLVTHNGMSLDRATEALHEAGYLDKEDPRELEQRFQEAEGGDHHWTPAGRIARAQAEEALRAQEPDLTPHDVQESGYHDDPEEAQSAIREALDEHEANTAAYEAETGRQHDFDAEQAERRRIQDDADEQRLEREAIQWESQQPVRQLDEEDGGVQSDTGAEGTRDAHAAEPAAGEEAKPGEQARPDFGLNGESQADAEARLHDQEAARKQRVRDALDLERRMQADEEARHFRLTGSDRDADANPDQGDLLASTQRAQVNFGPVHDQFKDDPEGAIARLMRDKTGEAAAVVTREGIGPINLVYGNKDMGLAHIVARRGTDFLEKLPALLRDGTVYSRSGVKDRVYIGSPDSEAVVRLDYDGKARTWLVTAYDRFPHERGEWTEGLSGPASTASLGGLDRTRSNPESNRSDNIVGESGEPDLNASRIRVPKFVKDAEAKAQARAEEKAQKNSYLGRLNPQQEKDARAVGMLKPKKTLGQQMQDMKTDLGKKLIQGIADQFYPIKQLGLHQYMLARLSKGYTGTFEAAMLYGKPYLRDGVPDVDIKDKGYIERVLAPLKGEHNRFFLWMAAMRAEQLMKEGRENLFTSDNIRSLKTLNQSDPNDPSTKGREARFDAALKAHDEFNKAVLAMVRESGLVNEEWLQKFADNIYVPFYRVLEDGNGVQGPGGSSGIVNQQGWKKLKGGTSDLNQDLLANVLNNWAHLMGASARNRAAVSTMDAAVDAGVAVKFKHPEEATKGAVRVMRDGKAEYYEINDKHLLTAVSAMSATVPDYMKPLASFKRVMTAGTTFSPTFRLANMIRDTLSTLATSDIKMNPIANAVQGWKASAHDSQTHASMLASGGIINFGTMLEGDEATRVHKLTEMGMREANILDNPDKVQAFWDRMHKAWDGYHEFGNKVENMNRAALYEQLRAKGKSHLEASFLARDVMDFSLQGAAPLVRFLTTAVPFLNARIQGAYKLGRASAEDPKRAGIVMGAVAMASLGLMLTYQDDPDWKARKDWDRDNYWWFKIGGEAFVIPKPFEVGAVGTLVERTWEKMFDPEMTNSRYVNELRSVVMNQFNMNPVPQMIKPLWDIYANRDDFRDAPIETPAMQGMQPEDRYTPSTTMAARMFGQLGLPEPTKLIMGNYSKLSPVQIESLVKGYLGWTGMAALHMADLVARPLSSNGARPALQTQDYTLGFVRDLPAQQSRYLDQFYDQNEASTQAYNTWREAIRTGQAGKARDVMNTQRTFGPSNRTLITEHAQAQHIASVEAQLALREKRIADSPTLSAETKRTMLNRVAEQRNNLGRIGSTTLLGRELRENQ